MATFVQRDLLWRKLTTFFFQFSAGRGKEIPGKFLKERTFWANFHQRKLNQGKLRSGKYSPLRYLEEGALKTSSLIAGLSQPIYTDVLEKDTNLEGDGLFAAMMGHDGWRAVVNYSL